MRSQEKHVGAAYAQLSRHNGVRCWQRKDSERCNCQYRAPRRLGESRAHHWCSSIYCENDYQYAASCQPPPIWGGIGFSCRDITEGGALDAIEPAARECRLMAECVRSRTAALKQVRHTFRSVPTSSRLVEPYQGIPHSPEGRLKN